MTYTQLKDMTSGKCILRDLGIPFLLYQLGEAEALQAFLLVQGAELELRLDTT